MFTKLKRLFKISWYGTGPCSPFYYPPNPPVKSISFDSIADLSDALIRAKDAHAEYERGLGQADTNWPLWYAAYLAMEQGLCGTGSCAGRVSQVDKDETARMNRLRAERRQQDLSESSTSNRSSDEEYWTAHE